MLNYTQEFCMRGKELNQSNRSAYIRSTFLKSVPFQIDISMFFRKKVYLSTMKAMKDINTSSIKQNKPNNFRLVYLHLVYWNSSHLIIAGEGEKDSIPNL